MLRAADHSDTPTLTMAGRHDGRITDLHAFLRSGKLVLALSMNPAIPLSATDYMFPSDLTAKIFIDRDSNITFNNPSDLATYGGTITNPGGIQEDIMFQITFSPGGAPMLTMTGLSLAAQQRVELFTGLRDDPFIRGPRIGRNIAAIVLRLPVSDLGAGATPKLLIWATAHVATLPGPFEEMGGRALRSMFPENMQMNVLHPRDHFLILGKVPDVVILDMGRPLGFPNGRLLTDDVVNLVGDPRVLGDDQPFPHQNDVAFLQQFPFLAPPQLPGDAGIPTVSTWGLVVLTLALLAAAKVYSITSARKAAA
jgi:hypothetical protein